MIELIKEDAFIFLQSLKDESVDLIFTDPPYWTLNKWRNVGIQFFQKKICIFIKNQQNNY